MKMFIWKSQRVWGVSGVDRKPTICKHIKSLDELKQAPLTWNAKIGSSLKHLGFTSCLGDPCSYKEQNNGEEIMIIALYVDD